MSNVLRCANHGFFIIKAQLFSYVKITDPRIHIRIEEDVIWFQIQMDVLLM